MARSTVVSPSHIDLTAQGVATHANLRPARDFARSVAWVFVEWARPSRLAAAFRRAGFLVIADLFIQVGINRWNGLFFDALERKDTATVLYGMQLILALAVAAAASAPPSYNAKCDCRSSGGGG